MRLIERVDYQFCDFVPRTCARASERRSSTADPSGLQQQNNCHAIRFTVVVHSGIPENKCRSFLLALSLSRHLCWSPSPSRRHDRSATTCAARDAVDPRQTMELLASRRVRSPPPRAVISSLDNGCDHLDAVNCSAEDNKPASQLRPRWRLTSRRQRQRRRGRQSSCQFVTVNCQCNERLRFIRFAAIGPLAYPTLGRWAPLASWTDHSNVNGSRKTTDGRSNGRTHG